MEWLTGIFSWLLSFFFGETNADGVREGGLVPSIWTGVKDVGGGIWDWFTSSETPTTYKLMAGLGAGYLLAPDATSSLVKKVANGASDVASTVGSTIWTFVKNNWLLLLGGFVAYKFLTDDD